MIVELSRQAISLNCDDKNKKSVDHPSCVAGFQ